MHYLKHLAWLLIGEAVGFGALTGVGGNGALIMAAALAGGLYLSFREGTAIHFAVWAPVGFALFVGSVVVLAALFPECPPNSCAWVGPTGDAVPLVVTSATGALAAAALLQAVERTREARRSTG